MGELPKKLGVIPSKDEIDNPVSSIIAETEEVNFLKKGKNIYITSHAKNIRLTINSFTNRIITVDKLSNLKSNKKGASSN